MTDYIPYFNYVAILLQLLIITINHVYSSIKTRSSSIFRLLAFVSLFSSIINSIFAQQIIKAPEAANLFLPNLFMVFGFFASNLIPPIYLLFIISITHEQLKISRKQYIITFIPFLFMVIAVITTPFTHFIGYFDENGVYNGNIGLIIDYLVCAFYLFASNVYTIAHRDRISTKQIHIVFAITSFIVTAIIVQAFIKELLIIQMVVSISIFLMYFVLRNPSEFLDRNNGSLNRTAFKEYFFSKDLQNKHFALGVIHLTNFEQVKQNYGTSNAYYLLRQNIDELQKASHFNKQFYLFHNTFVILDKKPDFVTEVLKELKDFIPVPMQLHSENYDPQAPKITVHFLTDLYLIKDLSIINLDSLKSNLQNPTDKLIDLLEFAVGNDDVKEDINIIDENTVKEYEEIVAIQQAIQKAIRNDSFEVYMQPIYDFKTNTFSGAESLLRLKNEEGKFIPPTRFIHEAELNGTILILGDISLRKTCEYINNANLKDLGITKVNVNLSIIQCMQDDIVEHLTSIIEEYNIPKDMIRFEITETLMAKDSFHLEQVMRELTDQGFEFALDDYGTGYSNTSRLLDFPFSEIKFDKSFVDSTVEDEKNAIPLKHLMNMVKDTGRIVLVEGVETKEMSDMVKNYGGDLIQGYYYSRPLPQKDFIEVVSKINTQKN